MDYLLFGAHPDDVEWGAGGICLALRSKRLTFVIADLTRGEMGSRGTREQRICEAAEAGKFLGASARENLEMPDTRLSDSPEARTKIAAVIRRHRPKVVLAPYWRDRHPDHAAAGRTVRNSLLYCALRKSEDPNPPHKPALFLYYLLHEFKRPQLVVDISLQYADKLNCLKLHHSQFSEDARRSGVIALGMEDYLYGLESRDRFFGSLVGARHGEALVCDGPLSGIQAGIVAELICN